MGQRTSVYLDDNLHAAVKASGIPLAELIRRSLTAAPDTKPATGGPVTLPAAAPVTAAPVTAGPDPRPGPTRRLPIWRRIWPARRPRRTGPT